MKNRYFEEQIHWVPLSGPLRKHICTCDWCISIHFVCFCVLRFVALFRAIIDFFEDFSDRSYSCLLPTTKSPLIIAISFAILEQSGVILSFVFAGQVVRYNEFGYKSSNQKKMIAKIFLPKFKKSRNRKFLNPQKSFDHPGHLKSGVPLPPRNSSYKKF